jgi:hypothetical protein
VFQIDFYDGSVARPKMRTQAWVDSMGGGAVEAGEGEEHEEEDEEMEQGS